MSDFLPAASGHADRSFPRLHPRPAQGWVNDPNGILYADGRWHLFFQYNPASARHDRICWGHVSSADLVHWEEHPVALRPQEGGPDAFGCWSGVGTIDDGVPTAVYSGVLGDDGRSEVVIARGSADAREWTQDGHVAAGMPDDESVTMVRDPFLFELGGRRWALQGAGLADGRGALLLYGADDLETWEYHGLLVTSDDPAASALRSSLVWECPQLVRIGDDWVAMFSLWRPKDHQGVGYLIGSLAIDEATGLPAFAARTAGMVDDGASFYAPQAVVTGGVDGAPERVLLWGWAQEVAAGGVRGRTQEDADAVGWSGLLTFPREVGVRGDTVVLSPARELAALRAERCDPVELPDQAEAVLTGTGSVRLRLAAPGEDGQLVWSGTVTEGDALRILLDASLVEIHRRHSRSTTLRAYPADHERYVLEVDGGVTAEAWRLALPA